MYSLLFITNPFLSTISLGPRLYRLGFAWLAFSAPLGYCVFHNTTATLGYLVDCVSAILDALWFFPWLQGVLEYFLLLPYKVLRALTGAGLPEESWKKVLEVLIREYSQREKEAMQVNLCGRLWNVRADVIHT